MSNVCDFCLLTYFNLRLLIYFNMFLNQKCVVVLFTIIASALQFNCDHLAEMALEVEHMIMLIIIFTS